MLDSLKTRTEMRRKAGEIYGAIVTQARQKDFYAELGVPDTPSGRYEMVVLHLFLVLERLRSSLDRDAPLPRMLVEAFVTDMDDSLRELATGDLAVAKKVRRAASGLYERSLAYRAAVEADDLGAAEASGAEHVFGAAVSGPQTRALAAYLQENFAALAGSDAAAVADGRFAFRPAPALPAEAP